MRRVISDKVKESFLILLKTINELDDMPYRMIDIKSSVDNVGWMHSLMCKKGYVLFTGGTDGAGRPYYKKNFRYFSGKELTQLHERLIRDYVEHLNDNYERAKRRKEAKKLANVSLKQEDFVVEREEAPHESAVEDVIDPPVEECAESSTAILVRTTIGSTRPKYTLMTNAQQLYDWVLKLDEGEFTAIELMKLDLQS